MNGTFSVTGDQGGRSCISSESGAFCFQAYTILAGDTGSYKVIVESESTNINVNPLPPPPSGVCSITTSTLCTEDADCPIGETCVLSEDCQSAESH